MAASAAAASSSSASAPLEPRHDFYQSAAAVTVSLYVRGLQASDVSVHFDADSVHVEIAKPAHYVLHLAPLFASIDAQASSCKVLASKVELSLLKREARQWPSLTRNDDAPAASLSTASQSAAPAAKSKPRSTSKWDTLSNFDDASNEPAAAGAGDAASLDAFFQKLYADADADTRRAMMKSYSESGGTSLSTNWNEVGKKKVDVVPPKGMEGRKWDQ
ncbi:SGS-domain-containing protein [Tilletiopsis washingtonensis]|uniref:SGS-domain-containing protein n=1 Tax=Tilletiopsis washingtonensis TaxID=58919 RepID=A0A316ZEU3_9BASI|nr:SGS-domain-containing protein [Tilletiopsis washingtonensis]PWN99442.1 SGS-domain-containing protein [Tilletiopsis washingtonensis]